MDDTTGEFEQWFLENQAEFESLVGVGGTNNLWEWLLAAFQMGYKKGLEK